MAGSISRGTAISIKNMGRCLRTRITSWIIAFWMIGCGALVELSTISACTKYSGNSSQRRALAWSACASLRLSENLRRASHHRSRTGATRKELLPRLDVVQLVQVRDKLALWQPMIGRQKIDTAAHPRLGIRPLQIALHPVTGRKNYHF